MLLSGPQNTGYLVTTSGRLVSRLAQKLKSDAKFAKAVKSSIRNGCIAKYYFNPDGVQNTTHDFANFIEDCNVDSKFNLLVDNIAKIGEILISIEALGHNPTSNQIYELINTEYSNFGISGKNILNIRKVFQSSQDYSARTASILSAIERFLTQSS